MRSPELLRDSYGVGIAEVIEKAGSRRTPCEALPAQQKLYRSGVRNWIEEFWETLSAVTP